MHADGSNLYLRVRGNSRSWIYRYVENGNVKELGLGSLKIINIHEARRQALELGVQRLNGISPSVSRAEKRAQEIRNTATLSSMLEDALKWWQTTRGTRDSTIGNYRYKFSSMPISNEPIGSLTAERLADAINNEREGVRKLRLMATKIVLKYAHIKDYIPSVEALVGDKFELLLTKPEGKSIHLASARWEDVPSIYAEIEKDNSVASKALCFTILHALRISETLSLTYEDIDFLNFTATVRDTKTSESFTFPLARQALVLFSAGRVDPFPISPNTVRSVLHKYTSGLTIHGFRASFSTWCADNRKDSEIRELCLQHSVGNRVTAAYQRSDLLEHRRRLMQEWADYVTSLRSSAPLSRGS